MITSVFNSTAIRKLSNGVSKTNVRNQGINLAQSNAGMHYFKQGHDAIIRKDWDSAIQYIKRALSVNSRNSEYLLVLSQVYYNKGVSEFAKGNWDSAINSYEKSIKINPNDPECLFNLGLAYYQKGNAEFTKRNWNNAIYYYKASHDLNPTDQYVLHNLSAAYHNNGNTIESEKYMKMYKAIIN